MELNYFLLNDLASKVNVSNLPEEDRDLLWCVTRVRSKAFCILDKMGLCCASGPVREFETIHYDFLVMWQNLLIILAQFPEEIKYNEGKVETPRQDAIQAILDTFNGLTSDDDVTGSMRELARIVGTNEDSSHDKLNYGILVGIINRIVAWAYPDENLNEIMAKAVV